MATIHLSKIVNIDPDSAWEQISAMDAAQHLTNMVEEVEIIDDDTRVCITGDGGRITERLISTDKILRRQAYTVTEGPFGHEHHNASWQVFDEGNGNSRIEWTIDLLPDSLADAMRAPFGAEFETLTARIQ